LTCRALTIIMIIVQRFILLVVLKNTLPLHSPMKVKFLSLILALDGGGWLTPPHKHFTPGNGSVTLVQEAGWTPGPVWMGVDISLLTGLDHWTVWTVAIPTTLSRPTDFSLGSCNLFIKVATLSYIMVIYSLLQWSDL
jgi:hypothetical protein